jgi:cardiolipin synthase
MMQMAGISVKRTNPLNFFSIKASLIARDHKKLIVIDNKIAFVGGFNLSEHNYNWHDTFTEIHDQETVSALRNVFKLKYEHNTFSKELLIVGTTIIAQKTKPLINYLTEKIKRAKRCVYIESPYFVNNKIMELLAHKTTNGVDVKVILPLRNNSRYIARIHKKYKRLYPQFVFFRSAPTTMLHAKHMVVDNYSVFGSSNFLFSKMIDNHEELSLVVDDKQYNQELIEYFNQATKTKCN